MAKMTGFKVFKGTKEAFISSPKFSENVNSIVFITGGDDASKSCIFAQGTYFANFSEFIAAYIGALNYVKGINVGGQSYNAAEGGGYVAFNAKDNNSTVTINVSEDGVVIGLHDDFVNKVNNTATDLGGKSDAADKDGSAFARIANLAALVSDLTGGSTDSIEGQITAAINALRTEIVGTLEDADASTLAAINDELDAIDAKWSNYVLKSDLATEVSDNSGTKVNVTVKTKDGKVSDVVVDETQLDAALNAKANASEVYTKTAAEEMAQGKVNALANGAVKDNADAIAVLKGNATVEGSIDKKIQDAINEFAGSADSDNVIDNVTELLNYVSGVDGSKNLASAIAQIAENKGKIETLNGDSETAGSVAKSVKDEADARDLADKALGSRIDSLAGVVGAAATADSEATGIFKIIEDNEQVVAESHTNLDARLA